MERCVSFRLIICCALSSGVPLVLLGTPTKSCVTVVTDSRRPTERREKGVKKKKGFGVAIPHININGEFFGLEPEKWV